MSLFERSGTTRIRYPASSIPHPASGAYRLVRVFLVMVLLIFLPGGSSVLGYVLPGPQILDLMVRNTGRTERLKVVQQLTIHGQEDTEPPVALVETLRYVFPDRFRSDIDAAHVRRTHVQSGRQAVTVIDGQIAETAETLWHRYRDPLLYRHRSLLEERLAACGIDSRISSLGRFQGHVAFVVGAVYPDDSAGQLWVDKRSFRPIRWIAGDTGRADTGQSMDIRYLDWQPVGKAWYPMRIEMYTNGRLLREIRVDNIQADPVFAENLFDISRLRSEHRISASDAVDPQADAPVDEVQKVIEEFKKIYE